LRGLYCGSRNVSERWYNRLHLTFVDNTGILVMIQDTPQQSGNRQEQIRAQTDVLTPYHLDSEYIIEFYANHYNQLITTPLPTGTIFPFICSPKSLH